MFRHDRHELERLARRLEVERARVAASRVGLARAMRHVFDDKWALLAPFTLGALTGAAAQHREPRAGGRFSARQLFAATTAMTGLVELVRDRLLPLVAGGGGEDDDRDPAGDASPAGASWRPPSAAAVTLPAPVAVPDAATPKAPAAPPWPRRVPLR